MASQRGSYMDQNFGMSEVTFTSVFQGNPKRNMAEAFEEPDKIKVYVRIRAQQLQENSGSNIMKVDRNKILMFPPIDSQTFKNLEAAGPKHKIHHLTFSKIFSEETSQKELFEDTVVGPLTEFIKGSNALVFTYGATSAGKTYTMQGTSQNIGILPRSIDVIFNSLGPYLMQEIKVKPERQCGTRLLSTNEQMEEERFAIALLKSAEDQPKPRPNNLGVPLTAKRRLQSVVSDVTDLTVRSRDSGSVVLSDSFKYSVWISCVEIYNEQIYDLLSLERNKGQAVAPLKLAEEPKGCFFIKGVKEVHVKSADEAYKVLLVGQRNLHFAATSLNHNSSRSHSIFQMRVIRISPQDGTVDGIHQIAFCDLAGAERTAKAQSQGDRLQEACRINMSLSTLHRVIDSMRQNARPNKVKVPVRMRESKLTSLLHTYFSGNSQTVMIVNISQNPKLFDETLHVLKFAALAEEVELPRRQVFAPPRVRSKRVSSIIAKRRSSSMSFAPGMNSTALTRPSVASSAPLFDLTEADESVVSESADELTEIQEEDEDEIPEIPDTDDAKILKDHIRNLQEKLEKALDERDEIEVETRESLVAEWQKMMAENDKRWKERLQAAQDLAEETSDRRLQQFQLKYQDNSRKRGRMDSDDSSVSSEKKLLRENEELKIAVEDFKHQLAKREKDLTESRKTASEMQAKIQSLTFSMSLAGSKKFEFGAAGDLPFQVEMSKDELVEKLTKLYKDQKALENEKAETEKTLEKTVMELERLLQESAEVTTAYNQLVKVQQKKESEIMKLDEKVDELEAIVEEYSQRCEEQEAEDKQNKDEIADLQLQLNARVSEMEELQRIGKGLRSELELKDLETIQLREELMHFQEAKAPRRTPKKAAPSPYRGASKENHLRTALRPTSPSPNRLGASHQLSADLKKAKDRVAAYEHERAGFISQLERSADPTQLAAAESMLAEAKKRIESLSAELNFAERNIIKLEEDRGELTAQLLALKQPNGDKTKQLSEDLVKANEAIEALMKERYELNTELEQLKSTNMQKLLEEKRELVEGICSLKRDYDSALMQIEEMKKSAPGMPNLANPDSAEVISKLTEELKRGDEAIQFATQELDKLKQQISDAKLNQAELQLRHEDLEDKFGATQTELAVIKDEKADVQADYVSLRDMYSEQSKDFELLKCRAEAFERAAAEKETEINRLEDQLISLKGSCDLLSDLEKKLEALSKELETERCESATTAELLKDREARIKLLEDQLKENDDKQSDLKKTVDALTKDLEIERSESVGNAELSKTSIEEREKRIKLLEDQLKECGDKQRDLKKTIDALTKDLEIERSESVRNAEVLKKSIDERETIISELKSDVRQSKAKVIELEKECEDLQSKIGGRLDELLAKSAQISTLEEYQAEMSEKLLAANQELALVREQLTEASSRYEETKVASANQEQMLEKMKVLADALDAKEHEATELKNEMDGLIRELEDRQIEVETLISQKNIAEQKLSEQIQDLRKQLDAKTKALEAEQFMYKETVEVFEKKAELAESGEEKWKSEVKRLQSDIEKMRDEVLAASSKGSVDDVRSMRNVQEALQAQLSHYKQEVEVRVVEILKLSDLVSKLYRKLSLSDDERCFVQLVIQSQTATNSHRSVSLMPGEIAAGFAKVKDEPKSLEASFEEPIVPEPESVKEEQVQEPKKLGRKAKTPVQKPKDQELLPPPKTGRALRTRKQNNAGLDDSDPNVSTFRSASSKRDSGDDWQPSVRRQTRAADRSVSRKRGDNTIQDARDASPPPPRKAIEAPKSLRKLYSATHQALECSPVPSLERESTHDIVSKKLSKKASKK